MKIIDNIRTHIGRWQLNREVREHKGAGKITPFSEITTVGILYNAGAEENNRAIREYTTQLEAEGKQVTVMGYIDQKTAPVQNDTLPGAGLFWREHLSSVNLPDKQYLKKFTGIRFDLLLSLYLEPLLPLLAATVYSEAIYKAGANIEGSLHLNDTLIDVGASQDLDFLIRQIDFYLKAI
jgi:hypothetical protein